MREITQRKLLIGEGREEVLFFNALLRHLGVLDVQVEDYAGKTKLREYIKALVLRPKFETIDVIAVTRDADSDSEATMSSVCRALRDNGLDCSDEPAQFTNVRPRIGVFLLPGGGKVGMLEDICKESVRIQPVAECVQQYLKCVTERTERRPEPAVKAWVHAWLASCAAPDKRLGEAAQAGYWPWGNDAFVPLIDFLRQLA